MCKLEHGTTQNVLRSFLGLCNVLRWFIPSFAPHTGPVDKILRKDQPKQFSPPDKNESATVASFKEALMRPLLFFLPRSKGHYALDNDASDKQIRYVLVQEQEDGSHSLVGYWSRVNNDKGKFVAMYGECLTVVCAVKILRLYLEGSRFKMWMDHEALRWILNTTEATRKLSRSSLRLSEFEFEFTHCVSIEHPAADAHSRLMSKSMENRTLDGQI